MLHHVMIGLAEVCQWQNFVMMTVATIVGLLLGVMPGLGPLAAIALLIPFTFTMHPLPAILALASISAAANCSGAFTSILLNVPGEPTCAATCFDGYPMSQNGRATIAIGLSIGAAFFGDVVGIIAVIAIVQPVSNFALAFGPPENFALAVIGVSFIASLSGTSFFKGMIMGVFGLWLSCIGIDAVNGEPRFTFGLIQLQDGIHLVPVMTGIFAVTEIIAWIQQRGTISKVGRLDGSVWKGVFTTFRHPVALVRSTLVGGVLGVIPGIGGVIASFLAYEVEKKSSSTPERFGKGAPEGVIAPEAANHSAFSASLAPALTLGIPGGATSALLIVALTVQGIRPGPMLFTTHTNLVFGFLVGLIFGAAIFMLIGTIFARPLAKITLVRAELLAPIFLIISFAGVYAQDQQFSDIVIAIVFGLIGCVAKDLDFPVVPLVLGLVLGRLLETSFTQSLEISGGDWTIFFTRPLSGFLLLTAAGLMGLTLYQSLRAKKKRLIVEANSAVGSA